MPLTSTVTLDESPWRAAPIHLPESIFVIGDVHGCPAQLGALLETFSALAAATPARLIFLGDLIVRGPSSLAALATWASPELDARFTRVHRLTGNHEQLLMLSVAGGATAEAAQARWMTIEDRKSTRLNSSHVALSRMPS